MVLHKIFQCIPINDLFSHFDSVPFRDDEKSHITGPSFEVSNALNQTVFHHSHLNAAIFLETLNFEP